MIRFGYVILVVALFSATGDVFASDAGSGTGGSGLPWEKALRMILDSFIGPVSYTFLGVGIVGTFAGMAIGGEIQQFSRQLIFIALTGAVGLFVRQIINQVWSGAVI